MFDAVKAKNPKDDVWANEAEATVPNTLSPLIVPLIVPPPGKTII